MKQCYKCKELKPLEEFGRVSKNKDGRSGWCKLCFAEYHREWNKLPDRKKKEISSYSLNGVSKSDFEEMYRFMIHLGYNPEEDVSKQFCEKYGLKYKPRRTKDRNTYSYQDIKKPPK